MLDLTRRYRCARRIHGASHDRRAFYSYAPFGSLVSALSSASSSCRLRVFFVFVVFIVVCIFFLSFFFFFLNFFLLLSFFLIIIILIRVIYNHYNNIPHRGGGPGPRRAGARLRSNNVKRKISPHTPESTRRISARNRRSPPLPNIFF